MDVFGDKFFRKTGFAVLLLCLCGQAALVYTDPRGRESVPLSATAVAGRRLFQAHNCQACHQIFGFGGFLGPDLTNVVSRHSPESIFAILSAGPGAMPSFAVSLEEARALHEFLRTLDQTGVSRPSVGATRFSWSEIPWFEYRRPPE